MTVDSLKSFLDNLAVFVRQSQGAKVAGDLEKVCAGLTPFVGMTTAEFAEFLVQAGDYYRTGILPVGKTSARKATVGKAKTASPEDIANAAQTVMSMYERFADAQLSFEAIDAELKRIDKQLNADGIKKLAHQVGIVGKPRSKEAALVEIGKMIKERKGSFLKGQLIRGVV